MFADMIFTMAAGDDCENRFLNLFRRFVDLGSLSDSGGGGCGDLSKDNGMSVEESNGGGRLPGDDLRNLRFKLLPAILEGPWIVRKAVGSKPTLMAQKANYGARVSYVLLIFGCAIHVLNI